LSQAILERVLASNALGHITTHLAPLKILSSETSGIQNAAMRYDVNELKPTYNLRVGQPGRSYALSIAQRIGLSEELLSRASDILGPEGERLERLLETLEQQRLKLEFDVSAADKARDEAFNEAAILRKQIERLRAKEEDVISAAAVKADEMLQDTLQRAKELKRTATTDASQRSKALDELQSLRKDVQQKVTPKHKPKTPQAQEKLRPGVLVRVEDYDAQGPIVEVRNNDVVVQLGLLKIEVPKRDVKIVKEKNKPKPKQHNYAATGRFEEELNIRGERVEQGLEKLRDFILEARGVKAGKIRILHGKGTGTLRDAVRNYLKNEKRVERYEDAVPYEGGHGVTIAYLK